jgi:hypothetical protein
MRRSTLPEEDTKSEVDLTKQEFPSPITVRVEKIKSSYTLDELKKIPDYLEQQTLHKCYARSIIPFGNLSMLGNLPDREKDIVFNPSEGDWTFEKNMAFMAAAIQQGRTFRLVTPLSSYQNHCDNQMLSCTMCEMLLLLDHGYEIKPYEWDPKQTIFLCLSNQEEKRTQPFVNYFSDVAFSEQDKNAAIQRIQILINNAPDKKGRSEVSDWRRSRSQEDPRENKPLAPGSTSIPREPSFTKNTKSPSFGVGVSSKFSSYGDGLNGKSRPSSRGDWRTRADEPAPPPGPKKNS